MARIISLFNHKGGVSKTTTTFNISWILAEMGKKVLMIDTDPQCNLTGLTLRLCESEDFSDLYDDISIDNIKSALDTVFEGKPEPLKPARCYSLPKRDGLYLLPGHIRFADFDVSVGVTQELAVNLKFGKNIPGAISHLIRLTADKYKFDYVIIDMSPSVSAINANIFMQSDYFIMPCSPDYFCNMAVSSLCDVIPNWHETYKNMRSKPIFAMADYKISDKNPKFIGTIMQKYKPRNGGPVRSFQDWICKISKNVDENLVPTLENYNMVVDRDKFSKINKFNKISPEKEPFNIANISDFNSLIAISQKYNVPVFALTEEQIDKSGTVLDNMCGNRNDFLSAFKQLAESLITLTS